MVTIHLLGSGCPTPTADRYGTSFAIQAEDDLIMIDCGPSATWKLAKANLNPRDVSTLFLTHHHFDHNVDTPCFLLTRWDQNADSTKPLKVFGPQPTVSFCDRVLGAFQEDWHARCNWHQSVKVYRARGGELPRHGPVVKAMDITPGWTLETKTWKATAGYADHAQPYLDCLAYRFDFLNGKSAVFSGDTGLCDEIIELARGADYFFCMSSGVHMNEGSVELGLCSQGAADPKDAGIMARKAGVKSLVLVHQGPGQTKEGNWQACVASAKSEFEGEVIFGHEITSFQL